MQGRVAPLSHQREIAAHLGGTVGTHADAERALRFGGRGVEMQHAGQRIAAPDGALRAGQILHLADASERKGAEVELRAAARIVQRHAVEQHQQVVRLRPAHPPLGEGATVAGRRQRESRQPAQRIDAEQEGVRV